MELDAPYSLSEPRDRAVGGRLLETELRDDPAECPPVFLDFGSQTPKSLSVGVRGVASSGAPRECDPRSGSSKVVREIDLEQAV